MRLAEEGFPDAGPSPLSRGIPNRLQRLRRPMGIIPLSRGIPPFSSPSCRVSRIIPALAGNTHPDERGGVDPLDHPRSRGEYGLNKTGHDVGSGSSPLSRGIRWHPRRRLGHRRIIPALAGNTHEDSAYVFSVRDHPRSRGEYLVLEGNRRVSAGSSPLSRGIPSQSGVSTRLERIIPALAGNTRTSSADRTRCRDHPRSRGEYTAKLRQHPATPGSSPLSRGILPEPGAHLDQLGIIPALAGNT